jgi:hypothetical protein
VTALETEILQLEMIQREFQRREITLQRLDDEIGRLNNYANSIRTQVTSLQRQKDDLSGDISGAILEIIMLVTNTDMRPSAESVGKEVAVVLEEFRRHTIEYKNTVNNLHAQIAELEQSRTKKNIDLQETLTYLQEADEMLRMKYAEFAEIGKEKKPTFIAQQHSKHISRHGQQLSSDRSGENSSTPLASASSTPKSIRNPLKTTKKLKGIKSLTIMGISGFRSNRSTETLASEFSSNDSLKVFDPNVIKTENKYHRFLQHSYRSLKKCELCQDNMWGKELRCETCSFHCHIKCSTNITTPCSLARKATHLTGMTVVTKTTS